MPQIKSQMKRVLTNNKRTEAVKSSKSQLKNAIKAVLSAAEANDEETAVAALNNGDMNHALLELLKDNPDKVLEGND